MLKGVASLNQGAVAITGGTINGTTIGATTPAAGSFTTLGASGVFTELKRASIYVHTAWDPSDVAGTGTNASNSSSATSTAASYITVANSSGTTTWTCVTAGLYRFTLQMWNETAAASTQLLMYGTVGGNATILLGTPTKIDCVSMLGAPIGNSQGAGGSVTFYANMTAGQTVTILPKIAVVSGGATSNFTTDATVSAEYCGATAN